MSDRNGNTLVWFLAGLGVGAVAGILYAPRSGSETREALRSRAEEGREYVRGRAREAREQATQFAREAREQATQWADKGRDVVTQQKEQFRAAYEAGRQAYHEATTESGAPKTL